MKNDTLLTAPSVVMPYLILLLRKGYSIKINNGDSENKSVRVWGESEQRLSRYTSPFTEMGVIDKNGSYYNLQGEMWRPDLNIEQAIDLAAFFKLKVFFEFPTLIDSLTTDVKLVAVTNEYGATLHLDAGTDRPQPYSTWASVSKTHKRNIARCIVHACILFLAGNEIYDSVV